MCWKGGSLPGPVPSKQAKRSVGCLSSSHIRQRDVGVFTKVLSENAPYQWSVWKHIIWMRWAGYWGVVGLDLGSISLQISWRWGFIKRESQYFNNLRIFLNYLIELWLTYRKLYTLINWRYVCVCKTINHNLCQPNSYSKST